MKSIGCSVCPMVEMEARIKTMPANTATKSSSVAMIGLRLARTKSRISGRRRRAAAQETAASSSSANATERRELERVCVRPIAQTPNPTPSRPSGLLNAQPRSGSCEKAL